MAMLLFASQGGAHLVDLRLKDKVILVTGGAKGIGAAIARAIAEEGAIPVIIDRDQDAAEKLHEDLRQCHGYSYLVVAELNTAEACFAAVEQTVKKLGRIDALVNNAGVNDSVGLEKGSPDQFVASLRRNLLHYYNMAHYALPHLKHTAGPLSASVRRQRSPAKEGLLAMWLQRARSSP